LTNIALLRGSQAWSSRYANEGSDYVLLASISRSDRSRCRTTLWFWFRVTPEESHITPRGNLPRFGNQCPITYSLATVSSGLLGIVINPSFLELFQHKQTISLKIL